MNRLLLSLVLVVACRPHDARQHAPSSTDSARLQSMATHAADTSQPVTQAPASLSPMTADAKQVCDSVAQRWREVSFSHVELRDTVADPVNHDGFHPERPDEVVPPTAACLVVARADSGIDHTPRPLYWPASAWVALLYTGADGPDGSSMTYQRGLIRCQVSDSWDGEDDSDSTYVPQKWFEQRTTCWRHNRALVPADTGQPTGHL